MATSKLTLKLLVDEKALKVLFAEANKEVVDFLFNLLAMPLGTVVELTKDSMVGSLGNLYNSVENLSETSIESSLAKLSLLEPKLPPGVTQVPFLFSSPTSTTTPEGTEPVYNYRCDYDRPGYQPCRYVSNICGIPCPKGHGNLLIEMIVLPCEPSGVGECYVKGRVTYTVMDDLSVTPMSNNSCITLLKKFNVQNLDSIEEKEVDLGMDEGLAILIASLQSKTVLTDVFLLKKLKTHKGESSAKCYG